MTNLQPFLEQQLPDDQTIVLADGLEDAFVGVGCAFNQQICAVYDTVKIINILTSRDGMTEEEAVEFFHFNIAGAYVGEASPIFVNMMERPTGQFKDTQTSSSSAVITQTQPKPKKKRRKHAVKSKA
jgi:hypothetical protein